MSRIEWEKFVLWCSQWEFGNHLHFEYFHYDEKRNFYEDVNVRKVDEYKKVDEISFKDFYIKSNGDIEYLDGECIATNRSVKKLGQFIESLT